MLTFTFQNETISRLGMGAMRLPVKDGAVDMDETKAIIDYAMASGINYFDTAYGYHGGKSEVVLGQLLSAYPRDSYLLADKFPGYDPSTFARKEEIFPEQLKRCQVDYFDFYLCHNLCENNVEQYLDPAIGIIPYLLEQKKAGKIRYFGFSTHASLKTMRRFLEAYGEHMEFCQIQLNWFDYSFQNAKAKLELLKEYGLPVWVMEPLRGGRLVNLTEEQVAPLSALRPEETVPAWSFRYLQSLPDVGVVLSGMSSLQQIQENVATFSESKPTDATETEVLYALAESMKQGVTVPCTACRYCTEYCPQGLDIPELLSIYNEYSFTEGGFIAPMRLATMPEEKKPTACLGCHSCEEVCPQQIAIADVMASFASRMGGK